MLSQGLLKQEQSGHYPIKILTSTGVWGDISVLFDSTRLKSEVLLPSSDWLLGGRKASGSLKEWGPFLGWSGRGKFCTGLKGQELYLLMCHAVQDRSGWQAQWQASASLFALCQGRGHHVAHELWLQDERHYCYSCSTSHKLGIILSLVSFSLNYEEVFRFAASRFFKKQLWNTAGRVTWVEDYRMHCRGKTILWDVLTFPQMAQWLLFLQCDSFFLLQSGGVVSFKKINILLSSSLVRWLSTKPCFLAQ